MNIICVNNYSRIKLGKSIINTKTYILKSSIELSNEFMTFPFGSNRSRYQFPEMFKYELKEYDINNQTDVIVLSFKEYTKYKYIYRLMVTRLERPNCSVTAKYFWSNGWTLDLIVSNIPHFKQHSKMNTFYTQHNIDKYLPENYGNVIVDIPDNIDFKPKLGIIVPCFGRHDYVKKCFDSIFKTILGTLYKTIDDKESYIDASEIVLVIVDESLTKDHDYDKMKTNKMIKDYKFGFPTIKIFKNKHGNMFDSFLAGCDLLMPYCEFIMNLDSDTIHKNDWINKTMSVFYELEKKYKNNMVLLSGFNTTNEGRHKIIKEFDNYYLKSSVGGCHLCFRTSLYKSLLRYVVISHKWDTNIHNVVNKNKGIIACTKPSVIDHIGEISSGHRKDVDQEIADKSIDF